MRQLILLHNYANLHNFKCGHFLRFHHRSSILKNTGRAFCKFTQDGKITNLHFQKQQLNFSSSFPFCTVGETPNDFAAEKHRTKVDFSLNNLRQGKNIILGIETLEYTLGRQIHLLMIKMKHNKNKGNKWIHICQKLPFDNYHFPSIAVPKDAYLLIKGMDSLMGKLADNGNNHPNCQELINDGLYNDYNLEIRRSTKNGQLQFVIQSIEKQTQKKRAMLFPIHLLPLLCNRMAKMLAKFNGSQQIEPPPSPLPKWILEEINNENTAAEDTNKSQEALFYRDTLDYKVDDEQTRERKLQIQHERGASGTEFIQIVQKNDLHFFHFPNILVPEDAYPLLDAMREMSNELQEKGAASHLIGENKSAIICQKLVKGLNYNYKLEIHSNKDQKLDFRLKTMTNKPHKWNKPKELLGPIPIHIFNWLKKKMAEILADYDEFDRNEENE